VKSAASPASDDQRRVAPELDIEHPLKDQGDRQHDEKEDREQRGELAGERDDRIAARAFEPGAHAAPSELGADRITGREHNNDVNDHRKQRAQQELGVIAPWIDQRDGFGDERTEAGRFRGMLSLRARIILSRSCP
jgi:hypothetical protein